MKKITTTIIFLLTIVSLNAQSGFSTNLLFEAKLEGAQVVPPVLTTALGESSFMLNASRDSLCINISAKGLSGPITGIMIHEGRIGSTGPVVFDLSGFIAGNRVATVITAPTLNDVFIATLMNGNYYINLVTANNPNGEIRGQIEIEADYPYKASLDGNQVVPPVTTTGTGMVTFDLSRSLRALRIRGVFENLSSAITGIVLERVSTTSPTSIVYDLTSSLTGNTIEVNIDPDTFAIHILRGNLYINVYTTNNPAGEIRGQLIKQKPFAFDTRLDGMQQVPPVATSAFGTGMIAFNGTQDTLWYDFIVSGLSGPPTMVQLNLGAAGTTGSMIADLSPNIMGNRIMGALTGSSIPSGFLDELLLSNSYVNVATSANPNGEVRGQLLRYAREGLTFTMDASQEVPVTTSTAIGTGIASIDRHGDNLHFRMTVSGLTGPVVSAHFHNAPAGQPGLVIFDLTPYFALTGTDDGAFNYWMRSAGFDSSKALLFLNDQVYVNIHTAQFSNGEVRGQVIHGASCSGLTIGVNEINPLAFNFNVFPNPFTNEQLNLQFDGLIKGDGQVRLYDLSSRIVVQQRIDVVKGINNFQIPADVVPGIYLFELKVNDETQMQMKVMKQ